MKLACTTADTSIAAGEFLGINQHIEAGSCVPTQTGTSSAKQITVSFYAKANANATYVVQLLNNKHSGYIHNNRTFNVTTSYQRFSITFQADTTADSKFDGDLTAAGFSLTWILHAGSNFTSATLASDWATGTTNRAAGASSFFSSTSNTFYITGVQLEVGDTATDFEHRTFADELIKCQRYYQKYAETGGSGSNAYLRYGIGQNQTTTVSEIFINSQTIMRADPTLIYTGTPANYSLYARGAVVACTGVAIEISGHSNNQLFVLTATVASGLVAGEAVAFMNNNSSTAFLDFNAEL